MDDTWHTGTPPEPGLYLRSIWKPRKAFAIWNGRMWFSYTGTAYEAEDAAIRNLVSDYQNNTAHAWKKVGAEHE